MAQGETTPARESGRDCPAFWPVRTARISWIEPLSSQLSSFRFCAQDFGTKAA